MIAKLLLDAGADPNIKTEVDKNTVLHASVDGDALWAVEMLLRSGKADVDSRNAKDRTPLHFASGKGNIEIVRVLFAAGADKLAKGPSGRSALYYAAQACKEEMVKFLLEQGIPVDIRDDFNTPVIAVAAVSKRPNVVKLLLEAGTDPDKKHFLHRIALRSRQGTY